jgi:hypothetical protein
MTYKLEPQTRSAARSDEKRLSGMCSQLSAGTCVPVCDRSAGQSPLTFDQRLSAGGTRLPCIRKRGKLCEIDTACWHNTWKNAVPQCHLQICQSSPQPGSCKKHTGLGRCGPSADVKLYPHEAAAKRTEHAVLSHIAYFKYVRCYKG